MSVSVTFFSLISQLLDQANAGLSEAMEAASGEELMFVAPKIEIQLRCVVLDDAGLKIVPSNGTLSNQYGVEGDSIVSLVFRLKPKEEMK
jgi:hypothetical protein